VAQVFNINKLKDFNREKRIRKKLFKTEQLWSEIVCYEPGQATAMHKHPLEEEMFYVIEGTANMNIGGKEGIFIAGELIKLTANIMHDVRNLQDTRLVIMFTKSPRKIQRKQA
jgi:quercetin dioxygenase-like cupin family protein